MKSKTPAIGRDALPGLKPSSITAPAIHKALTAKRDIRVLEHPDGSFQAKEQRPFPSQ